MKAHMLLSALVVLSGCIEPALQTDSAELVGLVEGTSAFAALRLSSGDRVEAYVCDGEGEAPTIQAWLSGVRRGDEVFLSAENPYLDVTLRGSLLGESFEGVATINGEAHPVSLLGATRPDGLYNLTFEDGLRRGWIVIGEEVRGPVQTLFKSNPIAFNNGALVNINSAGVVKTRTRFTANMLDGYTSSPLGPGRFLVEISYPEHEADQLRGDDPLAALSEARLRSASTNQLLALVYAPSLSSAGRLVFVAAPSLQSQSLSLVDTFTMELPNIEPSHLQAWSEALVQTRVLAVRM